MDGLHVAQRQNEKGVDFRIFGFVLAQRVDENVGDAIAVREVLLAKNAYSATREKETL
jgi:hypothetical protein